MKRLLYLILSAVCSGVVTAQQFPLLEGYALDGYHLSPSYAGLQGAGILFMDHRTDWTGIPDGPKSYQISYHNRFFEKTGIGGKLLYDKSDIFKQVVFVGTYSYEAEIFDGHILNFGLSAGLYRNSIDLGRYYDNPDYVNDAVLTYGNEKSKTKFTSDISVLYRFQNLEAGILYSNIMYGYSHYKDVDLTYKPLKNYVIHAAYTYAINDKWSAKPFLLLRGGQQIPAQMEFAAHVMYNNRYWGTLLFRTGGIFSIGIGGEFLDKIILNYAYSMSSNIAMNTFGSHQITLGLRIMPLLDSIKNK
jgi:type IX secretion system PorP/SprF family membrane protein